MEIKDNIILRRATMEDAELLFGWKNDKVTIENSISKQGVTMEEHLKWLKSVIENPNRQLFVLDVDGKSVGQLRLDLELMPQMTESLGWKETESRKSETPEKAVGLTAEISYGLGEEFRGKGLGKVLLEQAETLANLFCISTLTAQVLPHNARSRKLFKDLGFAEEKKEEIYVYSKQYR